MASHNWDAPSFLTIHRDSIISIMHNLSQINIQHLATFPQTIQHPQFLRWSAPLAFMFLVTWLLKNLKMQDVPVKSLSLCMNILYVHVVCVY